MVGFSFRSQSCMPELSNWNTATVSPAREQFERRCIIFGDRVQIDRHAVVLLDHPRQFSMTESVRSPRKSIFSRPAVSRSFMLYCVMTSVCGVL